MPTPAYLKIEGVRQGLISAGASSKDSLGNKMQQGHEDEIFVQAFKHTVARPIDPQIGQPTGPRVHKPMVITKEFDKSSPLLYNAMVTGEGLSTCTLKWYRTTREDSLQHYFTITLTDARIVDITAYMPNCLDPANGPLTHLEDVSISYSKIEWRHEVAGTSGLDDFSKPAA